MLRWNQAWGSLTHLDRSLPTSHSYMRLFTSTALTFWQLETFNFPSHCCSRIFKSLLLIHTLFLGELEFPFIVSMPHWFFFFSSFFLLEEVGFRFDFLVEFEYSHVIWDQTQLFGQPPAPCSGVTAGKALWNMWCLEMAPGASPYCICAPALSAIFLPWFLGFEINMNLWSVEGELGNVLPSPPVAKNWQRWGESRRWFINIWATEDREFPSSVSWTSLLGKKRSKFPPLPSCLRDRQEESGGLRILASRERDQISVLSFSFMKGEGRKPGAGRGERNCLYSNNLHLFLT